MTQILICNYPLEQYPPISNIIDILLSNKVDVIYIGLIGNQSSKDRLESRGMRYFELDLPLVRDSSILKFLKLVKCKFKTSSVLKKIDIKSMDQIWLFGEPTIWMNHKIPFRFKTISYLFEMPSLVVPIRYKIINLLINYRESLESSYSTVACEETRGVITQGVFGLTKPSIIIPNKNIVDIDNVQFNSNSNIDAFVEKIKDKKVILYQGIFNYPERQLEGLCRCITFLNENFVVVLVGGGENFYKLKSIYESDRVLFHDFIKFPDYLKITKASYIGFLSYYPNKSDIIQVLNVNFCAPNKIFEYGAYGLPMISNNVPSLRFIFDEYKCGKTTDVVDEMKIARCIKDIDENYKKYSNGSLKYFNSIDVEGTVLGMIC